MHSFSYHRYRHSNLTQPLNKNLQNTFPLINISIPIHTKIFSQERFHIKKNQIQHLKIHTNTTNFLTNFNSNNPHEASRFTWQISTLLNSSTTVKHSPEKTRVQIPVSTWKVHTTRHVLLLRIFSTSTYKCDIVFVLHEEEDEVTHAGTLFCCVCSQLNRIS